MMRLALLLSTPAEALATLGACVGVLAALVPTQGEALPRGSGRRSSLMLASAIGIALAALALGVQSKPFFIGVFAYTAGVAIATVIVLAAEQRVHEVDLVRRLRGGKWARPASVAFGGGLVLMVAAGVAIGVLLVARRGNDKPSPFLLSSPYRVSGTCVNGACTVNECTTPAPCGLENDGRLREGKPLDIVCQTGGKVATSPNGHRSRIWDRLPSGLYVSDLFVEDTAVNKFTRSLPRCSIA